MSDQFSMVERHIAQLLSEFPRLKSFIKLSYTRAAYYLGGGRRSSKMATRVAPLRVGPDDAETFFGYYDKSPLSEHGWLLCHVARHPTTQPPQATRTIALQVYDFNSHELERPALSIDSHCYNWQQGTRAQWLNGDHFIFNDFDKKQQRYISRVYCVPERCEVSRYDYPVQDSWGRDYFLSLNYQRLYALRPDYGYRSLPPLDEAALSRLDNDGIWRIDQTCGAARLLYSLQDICNIAPQAEFRQAVHKVNHIMISPDGRQFVFLHRYLVGRRKLDRLMLAAADGSELRVLAAHGMVSHCFWLHDAAVLCYARGPSGFNGYYIVDTHTGTMTSLLNGALDVMGDGHPYIQGEWLVTDTYPDRRRMQYLVRANLKTGQIEELGRFHQSFRYGGETRCDLHPRIAPDGRYVFFDSVCQGGRRLYGLELPVTP